MLLIRVTIVWIRASTEGRGALRLRDGEIWEHALWCRSCGTLGYDRGDIDAVLEADRLGVAACPRVVDCDACGKPTCDACAGATGTMCRKCFGEEPDQ